MVAGLRRAKFDQQVLWPEADAANHDFIWCENVIKEHSGSFYRAFSHLGYNEARAVYAIYAFCRTADDAVDEHNDAAELEKLSADLDKFAAGTTIDEPMWRALRITFDRYNLDVEPYRELLTGLTMDLNPEQPQNMDELDHYCYLVAGQWD
jgi:phytoene synthase